MSALSKAAALAAPSPATPSHRPSPSRAPQPRQHPSRPPLAVVRSRPAPARGPFVALIATLVVGGVVALLLLNTALTQGAFEQKRVSRDVRQLLTQQQALREHLAAVQEPSALAAKAHQLGLVASTCPVFLRLPAATVLGTPCPAKATPRPAPKPVAQSAPDATTATTVQGKANPAATGTAGQPTTGGTTTPATTTTPTTGTPKATAGTTTKPTTAGTTTKPTTAGTTTKPTTAGKTTKPTTATDNTGATTTPAKTTPAKTTPAKTTPAKTTTPATATAKAPR